MRETTEFLELRIERLESRLRVLLWVCFFCFAGLIGTHAFTGRFTGRTVRAQRFEIVDSQGRMRGFLGLNMAELPAVALYDAEGRSRAALNLMPGGEQPVLVFADAEGNALGRLGLTPKGAPFIEGFPPP